MTTNTNAAPTLHDRVMEVITDVWDRQLQIDEATATVIDLCEASTAAQPPADGALNTIAAMFHSAEEIEGPDGLAMMVDMSVWNAAMDSFEEIIGDEME